MNRQFSVLVLGLFLMSLFFSCSTSGSKKSSGKESKEIKQKEKEFKYASMKDGLLHLDLNEARKHERKVMLSEICDSLIYIPLQINDKSLMNNAVNKVMIDGDDLFIHVANKLLHFNINGKFLGQIGKTGRDLDDDLFIQDDCKLFHFNVKEEHLGQIEKTVGSPDEYVCGNFCLNRQAKKIYVKGKNKNYFMTFDYSGKLLKHTLKFEKTPCSVYFVEKDSTILSSFYYNLLIYINDRRKFDYVLLEETDIHGNINNVIKSKYFPKKFGVEKTSLGLSYNAVHSFMYDGKMNVQEISSDTVFVYSDKSLQPRFILDNWYKNRITFKRFRKYVFRFLNNYFREEDSSINDRRYLYNTVSAESDRYLFIGGDERFVYDKKKRELICYDAVVEEEKLKIVNDFDNCLDVRPYIFINNSYMFFHFSALDILEMYENLENPSNSIYGKRLKSIVDNLKEESNPVIVLARLKK